MDVVGWLTTPVEQHVVELINERLSSWEQTLSGAIDYFTGIHSWLWVVFLMFLGKRLCGARRWLGGRIRSWPHS